MNGDLYIYIYICAYRSKFWYYPTWNIEMNLLNRLNLFKFKETLFGECVYYINGLPFELR